MSTTPYASSRLALFISKRIEELPHKTQADIARGAGFPNANFITMLKAGNSKLALDRVAALAKALEVEPSFLMRLAIEQSYGVDMLNTLTELLGDPLSSNEKELIKIIRDSSAKTDPAPARTIRRVLKLFLQES